MKLLQKTTLLIYGRYKSINNHRSSGFRSNYWSFIATVLFRMVRNCRPHSSDNFSDTNHNSLWYNQRLPSIFVSRTTKNYLKYAYTKNVTNIGPWNVKQHTMQCMIAFAFSKQGTLNRINEDCFDHFKPEICPLCKRYAANPLLVFIGALLRFSTLVFGTPSWKGLTSLKRAYFSLFCTSTFRKIGKKMPESAIE